MRARSVLSPTRASSSLTGKARIQMQGLLLSAIATAAMRLVLDALQQVFVRNLAKDYERWVTDEGYRASRAEQSVPGPRHSSSSKQ